MSTTDTNNSIYLSSPEFYFNRERSHMQFNIRVLEQALDDSHPLLNRLMFLCIFSSNLDEFFLLFYSLQITKLLFSATLSL